MIKNIIFDMGQVLIRFDPELFINRVGVSNIIDKETLLREVYQSIEWSMMDRGTITNEDACKIIKKRVPMHLKDKISLLTSNWDRPIIPIDGAEELIKELKDKGYRIYLLSNAADNFNNYWHNIPGNEYFDGVVVSSYVKLMKPQFEIYNYLLEKYDLKANECVFIDDSIQNVEAATCLGINGIVFHNDYKEIRKKLGDFGVKFP